MQGSLDEEIGRLFDRGASRDEIRKRLSSIAESAEIRARRAGRGPKQTRYKRDEERRLVERVGRILFFLHHGVPADRATEADHALYALLDRVIRSD